MGKPKLRHRRKFGCPGGRHSFKNKRSREYRKILRREYLKKTIKQSFYSCIEAGSLKVVVKRRAEPESNGRDGYKIIHLQSLNELLLQVSRHAVSCLKAREWITSGKDSFKLVGATKNSGLACTLTTFCLACAERFSCETSTKIVVNNTKRYDINVRAVWGQMTIGGGCAKLNEGMATMGISGLSPKTFTALEHDIGRAWQGKVQEELIEAAEEERRHAVEVNSFHEGIPAISVICDGGWSKRSHKHSYNALGGVGIVIGLHTKKILHVGVRNKICLICSQAETRHEEPPSHDCFKNWSKSSQAMEVDIMLEAFHECEEKYGIRYLKVIADGDSSTIATIRHKGPIWCRDVEKIECANHAVKCLRSSLERLVEQNPHFKGANKLTKATRVRLTTIARCAIKMRSREEDRFQAKLNLEHDLKNSLNHVFGDHDNCKAEVCSAKEESTSANTSFKGRSSKTHQKSSVAYAITRTATFWLDGTTEASMEEARGDRPGGVVNISDDMRREVMKLLIRLANKSALLLGNFTTNLAENWMWIRTKFDGGKVFNRCLRGSWHARCYGAALRKNMGTGWSSQTWEDVTNTNATEVFRHRGEIVERHREAKTKCQNKPEVQARARKRKAARERENQSHDGQLAYGENAAQDSPDITPDELKAVCETYYSNNVCVTLTEARDLEKNTRDQSLSSEWQSARHIRLTSSNFGTVLTKKPTTKLKCTIEKLLYTTFRGTAATRFGLQQEAATIQEYELHQAESLRSNVKVEHSGLFVNPSFPYLGASPDGIVYVDGVAEGLLEVKNVLKGKPIPLREACKTSSFCLSITDNDLQLKRNHHYYYQCQGQLHISQYPWVDFVVRTVDPYEMHIERIWPDHDIWESKMLPKLTNFYFEALLPELASPRHEKVPGIREPGPKWNDSDRISAIAPGKCHTEEEDNTPPISPSRCTPVNFVSRRIRHEWVDEETEAHNWYPATVIRLVSGTDGLSGTEYEVKYDGDDATYLVDHLVEDYKNNSLVFM